MKSCRFYSAFIAFLRKQSAIFSNEILIDFIETFEVLFLPIVYINIEDIMRQKNEVDEKNLSFFPFHSMIPFTNNVLKKWISPFK